MALRRTRTGWVAQRKRDESWEVDGLEPTGIYINDNRVKLYIHYAGFPEGQTPPHPMELPSDPHLMRELAQCLLECADEREKPLSQRGR